MPDKHLIFQENLAAYALGSLDAEDTAALNAHLQTCDSCRAELAGYQHVTSGLLTALPPQSPSPALKGALRKHLAGATRPRPGRQRINWSFSRIATGLVIIVLFAISLFSVLQVRALQAQQAELTRRLETGKAVLTMLAYGRAQNLPISDNSTNVNGSLLIDQEYNSAVLILRGLPKLAPDKTYQIWMIDSQGYRTSAGLFDAESEKSYTAATLMSPEPFSNFVGVGVTVEPAGGSTHPTGPRIVKVDFVSPSPPK